jgi:demethylmenaquinone methyltransferase/2-methoxy-6-polyprenyl-1,4-benzoquinol methylase
VAAEGPAPAAQRTAEGVRRMFDRVAPRYDLANTVFSLGQDRAWRQAAARATGLAAGEVAADVACGTGALTRELQALAPGAVVAGFDFSPRMLAQARSTGGAASAPTDRGTPSGFPGPLPTDRGTPSGFPGPLRPDPPQPSLRLAVGDAMRLPLRDASVDVVTIAFGLRNLPEPGQGLLEFRRVLRPGGRLVVCEFSQPTAPVFRLVYRRYLTRLMPLAARRLTSDPEAYQYLARSIAAWPDQPGLARWLQQAGFAEVAWRDLSGGIVALHRGVARARR